VLCLDNVDAFYLDFQALWDISLTVRERELVALIGSNGAGKTTVLRTIAGFLTPSKGSLGLDGIPLQKIQAHQRVELGIALVPEGRRLFRDMTVLENLELGAYLARARAIKEDTLAWVFDVFPILKSRTNQLAGTLSGGEQQMLAIARGLMSQPRLLLVDELSLGLAPVAVERIYETLREINASRGLTILFVEQNVNLALQTAQRAYVLENGRIALEGASSELLENEQVKSAYLALG
jgi:branched-chain amino acid transport system ATP-binding protein